MGTFYILKVTGSHWLFAFGTKAESDQFSQIKGSVFY